MNGLKISVKKLIIEKSPHIDKALPPIFFMYIGNINERIPNEKEQRTMVLFK